MLLRRVQLPAAATRRSGARRPLIPILLLGLTLPVWIRANDVSETLVCRESQAGFLAPANSVEGRQYAPDRRVDILHLALEVTPDFTNRTVAGVAMLRFAPIAKPLRQLRLDAVDLAVSKLEASAPFQAWQVDADGITITFDPPLPPEEEATVTIAYSAEPKQGLYFRTPELGYRPEDTHLFSQGEAELARHWYPCYDSPNEKFTSEITCTVPAGMTVLSNGHQVSRKVDEAGGTATVRWLQDKPHVTYLMALAAGYFKGIEDQWRDVPLTFHAPASQADIMRNSFQDTRDIMAFFEREIGVLYPWDKYGQVCVQDFVAGGMENTSLTILTDHTLFPDEVGRLRSSQGLVAHEMAHQWFGDFVTCKDWSHLWLNEGFATYYENLYDREKNGRDSFLLSMWHDARGVLGHQDDQTPIVNRTFKSPDEQFSFRAYPKGGWVLHMLRSQLGEELYRRCIRTYLDRHAFGVVTTDDLNDVLEELSGRSWDAFLDQWVYHAGTPILDVTYRWDEPNKLARVSVKQTQKLSDNVLLFRFPLTLRFKGNDLLADREVTIRDASQDFEFPLPQAPAIFRVDPDFTVLAQVNLDLPMPMLRAQLDDEGDMLGRLFAVQKLADRKDRATVARLGRVLREDGFYGVRTEAAQALRKIHNDQALDELLRSTDQDDERVLRAVLGGLRGFYSEEAFAALRKALDGTNNPDLKRDVIGALDGCPDKGVSEQLIQLLEVDSFENLVAEAAIRAMRGRDDPAFIDPLLKTLRTRRDAFRSGDFGSALRTLAFLARHTEDRTAVKDFLVGATEERDHRVRRAALQALGDLGEDRAIPVLETFSGAGDDDGLAGAARDAINRLRSDKAPSAELNDLRREVLELKDANRQLRDDLDKLSKRVDASAAPAQAKR
ncbi:MAG: HEAT repeat domain-containing protein [Verrucomicrobiales bacterium]|nr:HEAT repeat domain-containing protein [Verrucomicrobiales bacterium]